MRDRQLIGLYLKDSPKQLLTVIAIYAHQHTEVSVTLRSANYMYDHMYGVEGTARGRIDYILDALKSAGLYVHEITENLDGYWYL